MISVYVAAWLGSILYGFQAVIEKIISKHSISNLWLFNFLSALFTLIGTAILAIKFGVGIPAHWGYIFCSSIFYVIGGLLYLLALYRLDVSVLSPLFCFRSVTAVFIGTIFLGEVLSVHQYFLVGIIFIFGILVSVDERFSFKSFFNWNIAIVFLDMIFITIGALFIKKAIAETSFWDTTLWSAILGQGLLLLTIPLFKKEIKHVTKKQYGSIVLVAVFGVIALLATNFAYAKSVSISSVIISLPVSMVIAFICSQFFPELLEKHSLKVYLIRFISAGIMIVAALNL